MARLEYEEIERQLIADELGCDGIMLDDVPGTTYAGPGER